MNLIGYTHVGNGKESVMPSDAALLSMLPFGLARRDALTQFYSSERNGNRSLKGLVESDMIEEHAQTVKSPRWNYTQVYYMLTSKGLGYIAQKYWYIYPWLESAVDAIGNNTVSFLHGISPGTVRSLLTAHACNVCFNLLDTETIFDRLISNPEQALTAMQTHANTTQAAKTSFYAILHAYRRWVEGLRSGVSEPVSVDCLEEYKSRFFDAIELKIPDHSPYCDASAAVPDDGPTIPERRERMPGHVGLLRTGQRCYVVYLSNRDGCNWNSAIVKKSWKYYTAEALRLGLFANLTEAPSVYPSFLLVDGVGQKVSAFRRAVQDPCHIRSERDKIIGKASSAVHAFPIIREGRHFVRFFLSEFCTTDDVVSAICTELGDTFRRAPAGVQYPLIYRNQLPCFLGIEMDLHQINSAIESDNNCAILCLDWQEPYIRAAAPDVIILVLDSDNRSVIEYLPDAS